MDAIVSIKGKALVNHEFIKADHPRHDPRKIGLCEEIFDGKVK
jgi:hypothetical protein